MPVATETVTHETTSVCPSSTRSGVAPATSHSMMCLSFEHEAMPVGVAHTRWT